MALIRKCFADEYDPTIGRGRHVLSLMPDDSYTIERVVDGRRYALSLRDTAGQEEYRGIWSASSYLMDADAFLLVYGMVARPHSPDPGVADITCRASLAALGYHDAMVLASCREDDPVRVVVGNKSDLDSSDVHSLRQVTTAEGLAWAQARSPSGALFVETSARLRINIGKAFDMAVRHVAMRRYGAAPPIFNTSLVAAVPAPHVPASSATWPAAKAQSTASSSADLGFWSPWTIDAHPTPRRPRAANQPTSAEDDAEEACCCLIC